LPANFEKGPAQFFNGAPPEQREAIKKDAGACSRWFPCARIARHSEEEITLLAKRSLDAIDHSSATSRI
jgi:hypothetical protein